MDIFCFPGLLKYIFFSIFYDQNKHHNCNLNLLALNKILKQGKHYCLCSYFHLLPARLSWGFAKNLSNSTIVTTPGHSKNQRAG